MEADGEQRSDSFIRCHVRRVVPLLPLQYKGKDKHLLRMIQPTYIAERPLWGGERERLCEWSGWGGRRLWLLLSSAPSVQIRHGSWETAAGLIALPYLINTVHRSEGRESRQPFPVQDPIDVARLQEKEQSSEGGFSAPHSNAHPSPLLMEVKALGSAEAGRFAMPTPVIGNTMNRAGGRWSEKVGRKLLQQIQAKGKKI